MSVYLYAATKLLAKPITARLTTEAERHPRFRNLLIDMAQVNNRMITTVRRSSYDLSQGANIPTLSDEETVQLGAKFMSETFISLTFVLGGVGGATLLYVMNKSARREAEYEEYCKPEREKMRQEQPLAKSSDNRKLVHQKLQHMNQQLDKLSDKLKLVHQEVRELNRGIEELVAISSNT